MSTGNFQKSFLAWFLFRPSSPPHFYVFLAVGWLVVDFLLWEWGATLPNEYRIGNDVWSINLSGGESLVFIIVPAVAIIGVNLAVRGAFKDWANLAQFAPQKPDEMRAKTFEFSPRFILSLSLVGALLATSHLIASGDIQSFLSHLVPAKIFLLIHIFFAWILFVQIGGIFLRICKGFNDLGKLITPNLVRPKALAPFSSVGLRMIATLCVICVCALLAMEFDFVFFIVPFIAVLIISSITFLLPQLGIRKRIRQMKDKTQKNLEEEILAVGLPGVDSQFNANSRRAVAELIIVRNLVTDYPDWPISSSNAVRLGLYLLLPLFSWGVSFLLNQSLG